MTGTAQVRIPSGKGIALRDGLAHTGPIALVFLRKVGATWASVNIAHIETAKFLRAQGIDVWMFANPEKFTVDLWRETVVKLENAAIDVGCMQIIADVEWAYENPRRSWATAPASEWKALAQAFLGMIHRGIAIGVTTYDSLRAKMELYIAKIIGPSGAFGLPQTYDHELGEVFTRPWDIYQKWKRNTSWFDIVPFVGSLAPPPHGTPHIFSSFQGYFQAISLNPWGAAILWYDNELVGKWLAVVQQWVVKIRSGTGGGSGVLILLAAIGGLAALLLKK